MKFSALNVDFNSSKSRFSRFKETCAQGHQRAVTRKSCYFTIVGQYFSDRHGMLPITTSTSDELFSLVSTSLTLKDPELPK